MELLMLELIKCMSVIAVCAYIFSQIRAFKNAILGYKHHSNILMAIIFFSGMSILGSYMNIPVNGGIANTRSIGITLSGFLYGPICGISVGIIAGFHRFLLGGFTAFASFLASTACGLFGGIMHYVFKRRCNSVTVVATGIISEIIGKLIILIIAQPFDEALELIKIVAIPMTVANTIGMAIFISIMNNAGEKISKQLSIYAHKILDIIYMTSPILRKGLNKKTSQKTA